MTADVTVLVPLHRSRPFADLVEGNLRRLLGHCRLTVSDATADDDTLEVLQDRLGTAGDEVAWLGPRPLDEGWIPHYEDLRRRVSTPYFLWLPHDDEIDVDYVRLCRAAVDTTDSICAFGLIEVVRGPGLVDAPCPPLPPADGSATHRANQLLFSWSLGIGLRGVFRTAATRPMLPTNERGEWGDIVWMYGVGLDGDIVEVPRARYRKRFYAGSTHARWRPATHLHALPYLHREVMRRPELADRDSIATELIRDATAASESLVDDLTGQRDDLRARLGPGSQPWWSRVAARVRRRTP